MHDIPSHYQSSMHNVLFKCYKIFLSWFLFFFCYTCFFFGSLRSLLAWIVSISQYIYVISSLCFLFASTLLMNVLTNDTSHTEPKDDQQYKAFLNLTSATASLSHSNEEDLSDLDATFYISLQNYHLLDHAGSTGGQQLLYLRRISTKTEAMIPNGISSSASEPSSTLLPSVCTSLSSIYQRPRP